MKHPLTIFREEKNLTLDALGKLIGAGKGTVWKWENGETIPRAATIRKIEMLTDGAVTPRDWYVEVSQ